MRCIAARLLLIFFIYLCLSFGVFGSFSIWLSLSVGLSVVVHPLFFLLCVFAVSCFYLCSIYQSSLHALCVSTTHISLPTRLLWISLSRMNSNERRSYGFAFFFCCIFFILFAIFIIIIVVTIIVILHRLSASPMDTLTDLFGSLIIVCNSSLFYKWVCVWMVYMCCFRRLTLNIVIKGSKRYKNNT